MCTSRQEDLVTFFVYPGHAGHDYGTIEKQGFSKLVLERRRHRDRITTLEGIEAIMDLKNCRLLVTPTSYGKNDPSLKTELEKRVGAVVSNPR